jgi:hypothetical protein
MRPSGIAREASGPRQRPVAWLACRINQALATQWQRSSCEAKVGGWTETRPVSLGLLPSGPDPVGEWCVHRQPPSPYLDQAGDFRKLWNLEARKFNLVLAE